MKIPSFLRSKFLPFFYPVFFIQVPQFLYQSPSIHSLDSVQPFTSLAVDLSCVSSKCHFLHLFHQNFFALSIKILQFNQFLHSSLIQTHVPPTFCTSTFKSLIQVLQFQSLIQVLQFLHLSAYFSKSLQLSNPNSLICFHRSSCSASINFPTNFLYFNLFISFIQVHLQSFFQLFNQFLYSGHSIPSIKVLKKSFKTCKSYTSLSLHASPLIHPSPSNISINFSIQVLHHSLHPVSSIKSNSNFYHS